MRKTIMAALGAAVLVGVGAPGASPASAGEKATPDITRAYPNESYSQWYWYRGRRYWGRGPGPGAAVAAGVAGLAAGAIVGSAIANNAAARPLPQTADPDFIAYCSRKYRTFDPQDGTFLARDGQRYMCQYP
jgi:hypothetical protein